MFRHRRMFCWHVNALMDLAGGCNNNECDLMVCLGVCHNHNSCAFIDFPIPVPVPVPSKLIVISLSSLSRSHSVSTQCLRHRQCKRQLTNEKKTKEKRNTKFRNTWLGNHSDRVDANNEIVHFISSFLSYLYAAKVDEKNKSKSIHRY